LSDPGEESRQWADASHLSRSLRFSTLVGQERQVRGKNEKNTIKANKYLLQLDRANLLEQVSDDVSQKSLSTKRSVNANVSDRDLMNHIGSEVHGLWTTQFDSHCSCINDIRHAEPDDMVDLLNHLAFAVSQKPTLNFQCSRYAALHLSRQSRGTLRKTRHLKGQDIASALAESSK
jgi:hypothetical protein